MRIQTYQASNMNHSESPFGKVSVRVVADGVVLASTQVGERGVEFNMFVSCDDIADLLLRASETSPDKIATIIKAVEGQMTYQNYLYSRETGK